MRKLKIFVILCLLSYCTAFVAFAANTIKQPQTPPSTPTAKNTPVLTTEALPAPLGIGAQAPAEHEQLAQLPENSDAVRIASPIDSHADTPARMVSLSSTRVGATSGDAPGANFHEASENMQDNSSDRPLGNTANNTPDNTSDNTSDKTLLTSLMTSLVPPLIASQMTPPIAPVPPPAIVTGLRLPAEVAAPAPSVASRPASPQQIENQTVEKNTAAVEEPIIETRLAGKIHLANKTRQGPPPHQVSEPQQPEKMRQIGGKQLTGEGQPSSHPTLACTVPVPSAERLAVNAPPAQLPSRVQQVPKITQKGTTSAPTKTPNTPTFPQALPQTSSALPVPCATALEEASPLPEVSSDIPMTAMPPLALTAPIAFRAPVAPGTSIAPKASMTSVPTFSTAQHNSSTEFFDAAQVLQGITITPGFSQQLADNRANHSSLPVFSARASSRPTTQRATQLTTKLATTPSTKSANASPTTPMKNQSTAPHQADKKKIQLANGLTAILQKDDRFPLVSLRLYVHAGSAYEKNHEAGISHVLEHMVFKGSQHYGDGEIAREVEHNGGYLNAFTSFDQTGYIVDLPSSQWEKGLAVLKEMAFLPKFSDEHLASEKEVIVSELKRGNDSPGNVLFTQMIADMFIDSPYAHPIIGFEETIRAMTVNDLYAYHQRWYQPQAMTLVICGNIELETAESLVIQEFEGLTNTKTLTPPKRQTAPLHKAVAHIQTGPWQKVRLALAFHAPRLQDNNAVYLDLLAHMIGGDQTSPLFKKYKYDKRLVDSISMQSYNFEESGLVFVMATLDAANVKAFWQELLQDMQKGFVFEQEDLARAQLALQDAFYRSRETLEGYTAQIGHFNFYFKGEADAHNYLATIANTNLDILNNVYTETFQPQRAGIFGIVPKDISFDESASEEHLSSQHLNNWLLSELNAHWKSVAFSEEKVPAGPAEKEIIDLGNGCSLVLLPDTTLPYISATLLFNGGESLLTDTTQGLGALTAGLLPRGTASKDYNAIQTFLSERAATLNASSNRQTFGISFSAPNQYTRDIFALASEIIRTPSFLPDESERVKENIQAAIVRAEEQPLSLAFRHLTAFLYPNHSYGFLQLGTPESIASFTHSDAKKHWEQQRNYPWTLSLCGDFAKDEILELAKQLPVPSKKMAPLSAPELTQEKTLTLQLADREQAHLFLVFPIPGTNSPDEAALELLTTVLAGQSGLLFSELRDKQGLGYTVTAFPWKTQKAGALIFYIGTELKSVDTAYTGFANIIDSLKASPLNPLELERGKNVLAGEYYRERQSLGARSAEGATFTALGLPLDFKLSLTEQSQKLNAADIQKVAQTYLDLENSFIIKVLPKNTK